MPSLSAAGLVEAALPIDWPRAASVLVVERGDFLRPGTVEPDQPMEKSLFPRGGARPPLALLAAGPEFYGAALYRLHEMDFVETAHEAGTSPAWPIG